MASTPIRLWRPQDSSLARPPRPRSHGGRTGHVPLGNLESRPGTGDMACSGTNHPAFQGKPRPPLSLRPGADCRRLCNLGGSSGLGGDVLPHFLCLERRGYISDYGTWRCPADGQEIGTSKSLGYLVSWYGCSSFRVWRCDYFGGAYRGKNPRSWHVRVRRDPYGGCSECFRPGWFPLPETLQYASVHHHTGSSAGFLHCRSGTLL